MAVPHKMHLEALLDRLETLVQRLEKAVPEVDEEAQKAAEKYIERRAHEIRAKAGISPPYD